MFIEKRNALTNILLSIVTCGIYGIIWAIAMVKDVVKLNDDPNDNGLVETILMIFLPFLGFFLAEKKLADACAKKGIQHQESSIVYLLLGLFGLGIVNYYLLQTELNRIADIINPQQPQYNPNNPYNPNNNPSYNPNNNPYNNGPVNPQ